MSKTLTRRRVLSSLGLGTGAFLLSDGFLSAPAEAETSADDFSGAWDTLMCLDPRDHTDVRFNVPGGDIYTGYELVAAQDNEFATALSATANTGLVTPTGSNISFGPAIGDLAAWHDELCVIRGVNMGTLSHSVGRRYFLTGKFPRGLAASGSSLGTVWAAHPAPLTPIPNLVMRSETYNEDLDPRASGLQITSYQDLATVLQSLNPALEPKAELAQALAELQHDPSCLDRQLDGDGITSAYRAGWQKSKIFAEGSLWQHFNFINNPPPGSPPLALYEAFGLNPAYPNTAGALSGPKGQAAVAAQALTNGISQSVSIQLAVGIDHHYEDWASDHAPALRDGFNAVAALIAYLKNTEYANGESYWDRTTLLCYSDFARTPNVNARGGRDHHLASACLVAGKGIKGNAVIGATNDVNYGARTIDLATGAPDDELGVPVRPPDVHATLLTAAGLPTEHISNQDPLLIDAALV